MSINIEQITFGDLSEVAYGTGRMLLCSNPEKKVTVKFSVEESDVKLNGFIELDEDAFYKNASRLREIVKEKFSTSL
ncbi:hypothetical protein KDN24_06875 [Bacillus sp. Bva_UNVM-123]|uniref:hypothetical protein n=1 Tax=Bacillus sp. Bva_UNVM-123 TaxID=2829798 RepID=UPI00391F46D5